ncbi:MAG: AbrB/MazE/SpoVT family DNA-binding domain-containing protein [archaeon]
MKRKIVRHGSSSLTITLPIAWAETYKLKKGDEVNVDIAGNTLTISTEKEAATAKKEIDTRNFGLFTKNHLSHLYQLGYDHIEIRYESGETAELIKQRLPDCVGYMIIDQAPNRITIKSIATTIESEFDTLLRKSFQITNEMAKELQDIMHQQEYTRLNNVRSMEALNNRFTDICLRILNKRGYTDQRRVKQMYEIVKSIERIADEFKYICDELARKKSLAKETLRLYTETVNYYLCFYELFYQHDKKHEIQIHNKRIELITKLGESLRQGKDAMIMHHLINIVQKTYEGAGSYFALVL